MKGLESTGNKSVIYKRLANLSIREKNIPAA